MSVNHTHTDTRVVSNDEILDDLHARLGDGWDDETDIRTRYGVDVDAPRVERIRVRKAPAHLPGVAWDTTACLCSCHFGQRTRTGAPACDERECIAWAKQNAAKAAKLNQRKAQAWARKHGQVGA